MKTAKLMLRPSPDLWAAIRHYCVEVQQPDTEAAVLELIQYALMLPPYFRQYDWPRAEGEAEADIRAGHVAVFESADDLMADLEL